MCSSLSSTNRTQLSAGEHSPAGIPKAIWLIAAAAFCIRLGILISTHFTSEDFLITLRYAQNLADGRGLVFNRGEWVLGTTTPLYTLILAALAWLKLPAALLGKLLNIGADTLLCPILYRWVRALGGDEVTGVIAALLSCICPLQINWAVSGMETGLVTLGCTALWMLAAEGSVSRCYLLAALVVLVRWDALLVLFFITLQFWHKNRRLPFPQISLTGAILLPFLLAAKYWYGTLLPGTASAKSQVYGWRADHLANPLLRHLPELPKLLHVLFWFPYGLPFTIAGLLGLVALWQKRSTGIVWPILWMCAYWGSFLVSRILLFTWYLVPPLPLLYVLSAFGIGFVVRHLRISSKAMATALAAGAVLLASSFCVADSYHILHHDQLVEDTVRIPMGLWLRRHANHGDTVMLEPIGYVGYYSKLRMLDVIGLVSPQVLRFYKPSAVYPPFDIAMAYHPQWCVLRPGELDHVRAAAHAAHIRWSAQYHLVKEFSLTPTSYIYYIFKRAAPASK